MCSKFFCTLRYIVRQRAYVIYDAIIYSKRPLLRLRLLPSNNELSAEKAHTPHPLYWGGVMTGNCVGRLKLTLTSYHLAQSDNSEYNKMLQWYLFTEVLFIYLGLLPFSSIHTWA